LLSTQDLSWVLSFFISSEARKKVLERSERFLLLLIIVLHCFTIKMDPEAEHSLKQIALEYTPSDPLLEKIENRK
jgi:hypothetical protein